MDTEDRVVPFTEVADDLPRRVVKEDSYIRNRDKRLAYARAYYEKNRERILEQRRATNRGEREPATRRARHASRVAYAKRLAFEERHKKAHDWDTGECEFCANGITWKNFTGWEPGELQPPALGSRSGITRGPDKKPRRRVKHKGENRVRE
jgi:hypothetical protein